MIRVLSICILLLCVHNNVVHAEPIHYVVEGNFHDDNYETRLLRLILDASKNPEEIIEFKRNSMYDQKIPQPRQIAQFAARKENLVMWKATSKKLEAFLLPIRVPNLKGIVGYRSLLIRKEDQAKFANIKSKKQLQMLVAGQGEQWEDTLVLRANGFPVMTATAKEPLYKMLAAKHFDYFPRGIAEIDDEKHLIEAYGLMVEPHLMLEYPSPFYFFVNKHNVELANRLKKGWEIIINNGTFDKFFFNEKWVKIAIAKIKESPRFVLHLKAPDLSEQTPLNDPRYWLDLSAYCTTLPDDINTP